MPMPKISADASFEGAYQSFGQLMGTEILRPRHNGSLPGIVFKYEGGLMTARHVMELCQLSGYKRHECPIYDIAFKEDKSCRGLKLGYVDKLGIDDVSMVTSSIEEPNMLVALTGSVGVYFMPIPLRPFYAHGKDTPKYFKPGASGSPLIYKDHIIGVVPFQNLIESNEVAAVIFNGKAVRDDMERFGLVFEDIV